MASYSQQTISSIIDATDIVSLVSAYTNLKKEGRDFLGLCPFHKEKTPSFRVNPSKQMYYCFGCGVGGDALNFISEINHLDFRDALKYLAQRAGIPLDEDEQPEQKSMRDTLLNINERCVVLFQNALKQSKKAAEYLTKRKLSPATVEAFKIGFAPPAWDYILKALSGDFTLEELETAGVITKNEKGKHYDRFRDRIIFPIFDTRNNCIGFGGRVLGDGQPKYLNSPETPLFSKGRNLYALNLAKSHASQPALLTEGYMDVVSLHQKGIATAIATLGTAFTPEQGKLLERYFKSAVLLFDSDGAGQKATLRTLEIFNSLKTDVKVATLERAKDPDEFINKYGVEAFNIQISRALSATSYYISLEEKRYDINNFEQRLHYCKSVAKILSRVKSEIEVDAYANDIAMRCGITPEAIHREINAIRNKTNKNVGMPFKTAQNGEILLQSTPSKDPARNAITEAERMLICNLFSDVGIIPHFPEIEPNFFTDNDNKSIFALLLANYSETGRNFDLQVALRTLPKELSSIAASIFIHDLYFDDSATATKEVIEYITRNRRKNAIIEAGHKGVEELQRVICHEGIGG